jgi:hypothetical protein
MGGKTLITAVLVLTVFLISPVSAQEPEVCAVLHSDLDSDTQTELQNRHEQVLALAEILGNISYGSNTDAVYSLASWAVMADSGNDAVAYPDCDAYLTLEGAFTTLVNDVYALASQYALVDDGRLTELQTETVYSLLRERSISVYETIDRWVETYNSLSPDEATKPEGV